MTKHARSRMLLVLLLLSSALPAHAYIDPGTGSALFYVVTGMVLSVYFTARGLYYRGMELLFRVGRRGQRCEVAIHCEDARYETTFLPIIRSLRRRGVEVMLFTMYPRDGTFADLPEGVSHQSIPQGMIGYAWLNGIEATVLITTTPQLDVMTFRRSRRVGHYVMVQHALGECRFVRPYAYDYFDSVLCCGPILMENIRRMEQIRGSAPKSLYPTGVPHYDELLASARRAPSPSGKQVVLVAPSWGPLSMFEAFGVDFIQSIAARYRVIVRPHPQMKVSQPELYARILDIDGVEIDTGLGPAEGMARADVLLSDISGIAYEFAFIHERPVLVIDREMKLAGLEGEVLGGTGDLKRLCADFIVPVPPSQIHLIADHIDHALANRQTGEIAGVRDRVVYNFGHSAEVAAAQIEGIYRSGGQAHGHAIASGWRSRLAGRRAAGGTA